MTDEVTEDSCAATSEGKQCRDPQSYRYLVVNTGWSVVSAVASRASTVLGAVIVARVLGREAFGRFAAIQSTCAMIQVFAAAGLGIAAAKFVAQFRADDKRKAGGVVLATEWVAASTGLIVALALVLGAGPISARILGLPDLRGLLRVSAASVAFTALFATQNGALCGFGGFKRSASVQAWGAGASLVLMALGVSVWGVGGAVAALVASSAVAWGLSHVVVRRVCASEGVLLSRAAGRGELAQVWRFSVPTVLSAAIVAVGSWLGGATLLHREGGIGEFGAFNAANQVRNLLLFVPALLGNVALTSLSAAAGRGDFGAYRTALARCVRLVVLPVCAAVFLVCACGSTIMAAFGGGFRADAPTLSLLSLSCIPAVYASLMGVSLTSLARVWGGVALNLIWAGMLLGLSLVMSALGGVGVAAAALVSYVVHAALVTAYVGFVVRKEERRAASHFCADAEASTLVAR